MTAPTINPDVLAFQLSPQLDASWNAWLAHWRGVIDAEMAGATTEQELHNVLTLRINQARDNLYNQGAADALVQWATNGPLTALSNELFAAHGGHLAFLDAPEYAGSGVYTGPWTGVDPDAEPEPMPEPMTAEAEQSLRATLATLEAALDTLRQHVLAGLPGAHDTMLAAVAQIDAIRAALNMPASNIVVPPPVTTANRPTVDDGSGMTTEGGSGLLVAGLVLGGILFFTRRR